MIQTDISKAQSLAMARSLMGEFGYAGAWEYAIGMKNTVRMESNRRVWADVAEQIRLMAHPLAFRQDLVPWIIEGRKTATTRRRVKLHPGDEFYITDDRGAEHGYRIVDVREAPAEELIGSCWGLEGYGGPLEMAFDLARIYPDITPGTPMAIHIFEAIA